MAKSVNDSQNIRKFFTVICVPPLIGAAAISQTAERGTLDDHRFPYRRQVFFFNFGLFQQRIRPHCTIDRA